MANYDNYEYSRKGYNKTEFIKYKTEFVKYKTLLLLNNMHIP